MERVKLDDLLFTGFKMSSVATPSALKRVREFTIPIVVNSITAGIPHGLGGVPKLTTLTLRCISAEHGYAVGDEYSPEVYIYTQAGGGSYNFSKTSDANNIYVAVGAAVLIPTKSAAFTAVTLTPAKWEIVVRVFR